ncbi:MAG: VacJ family lipoprotein [Neomegalonema sp.]|nr:VacJ family lipoprotein [Neomegalonema sp.]
MSVSLINGRVLGRVVKVAAAALASVVLAGCASNKSVDSSGLRINDPFEDVNRDVHGLNKGVDKYFLRPVAMGYDAATPGLVRLLIRNGLNHLELPRDFVSHLLSGEVTSAGRTVLRFGVNTIVGAGGLLDPATEFELPKEDADMGKVFATWGFGEGFYYEIPVLGPTTVRHTAGRIFDIALAPTTYIAAPFAGAGVRALETVEFRSTNRRLIDSVLYDSADSYATTRALYYQTRRKFVTGKPDLADAPKLEAE